MSAFKIRCTECGRIAAVCSLREAVSLYWAPIGATWICHNCAGLDVAQRIGTYVLEELP